MKVDLSSLLSKREPAVSFSFTVFPESVEDAAILPEGVKLEDGLSVSGKVTDCAGYFMLRVKAVADYKTVCDRCLAPIEGNVEFPFERIVVSGSADLEKLGVDEDDVLYVADGGIDFDCDIVEALCLELPAYFLCEEDCPGLCSKCGQRLDGKCTCKTEKEIDPRLESFQKLLEKMKKE